MQTRPQLTAQFLSRREKILRQYNELVLQIRDLEKTIEGLLSQGNAHWMSLERQRNDLRRPLEPLIQEYWNWIPQVVLSRCPFCDEDLWRLFDPVDFAGFWWMDRTQRPAIEPKACEHFCLLSGAVNLRGRHVQGGFFESFLGPDAPFVIPRVLDHPDTKVVVSVEELECEAWVFPIAYFSQTPLAQGTLTQSWARKEYVFTSQGRRVWDIKSEHIDFHLDSWVAQRKLSYFHKNVLSHNPFPEILKLKAQRQWQRVVGQELTFISRPVMDS